jgi:hypothetical protein
MFRMNAFPPSSIINMENVLQEVIKIGKLNLDNQQAPCKFPYTSESLRGFGANFDAVRSKDGRWFGILPLTCKSTKVHRANVSAFAFLASWHFQYQESTAWDGGLGDEWNNGRGLIGYYTRVYMVGLRKTKKNLSFNSEYHGQDSNPSTSQVQIYNVTFRRTCAVYRW